jgi:hypothetical protein
MRRLIPGLLIAVLAVSVAACGSSDNVTPTPTTPTTPAATITETFPGTLTINGAATFPFTATTAGTVTATLTSLLPDGAVPVGLAIGTWTGSACQIGVANDGATQAAVVTGTAQSAVNLCVRIYDVGKLTSSMDFSITIVHP